MQGTMSPTAASCQNSWAGHQDALLPQLLLETCYIDEAWKTWRLRWWSLWVVAAADSDYLQNEHTLRQWELQGKILPATTQPLPQDMKNICQNSMLIAYGKCANLDHTKYVHYPIFLQLPPSNILTIKLIPKSWFITCIKPFAIAFRLPKSLQFPMTIDFIVLHFVSSLNI